MSQLPAEQTQNPLALKLGISNEKLSLIKRTVAKNATDDELELFFYRCTELKLNPLMPGQIYFVKFGNNPGSIIVGLEGFRAKAHRTGQLNGIKRGKITDDDGNLVGAWADVYRKDCLHPFHEEVALHEYADTRKPIWKNMPETMIKKVAEVAALRMAFPDDLGGVYIAEEFHKAEKDIPNDPGSPQINQNPKVITQPHMVVNRPTEKQLKRLFAITMKAGITVDELKDKLLQKYKLTSTKELTLGQYDELCKEIESQKEETPPPIEEQTGEWVDEASDANEDAAQ